MAESNNLKGMEGAACSAGLSQPVVELVDVVASTSRSEGMKCPTNTGRRVCRTKPRCSDDEGDSDSSLASVFSTSSKRETRKRGRPPTTGDYIGLAEAKKLLVEQEMVALEVEAERMVLDPCAKPVPSRSSKDLPSDHQMAEEFRQEPVGSLCSHILEAMEAVERVAAFSKNLKGTSVRALRLAAQKARVASTELTKRTGGDGGRAQLQAENERLRSQMEGLQEEVQRLSTQVNLLLGGGMHSSPPRKVVEAPAGDGHGGAVDLPPPSVAREPSPLPAAGPAMASQTSCEGQDDALLRKIGEIIDRRLAAFYMEVFPERAARPPLRADAKKAPKRKTSAKSGPPVVADTKRAAATGNKPPNQSSAPEARVANAETWSQVVGRKAARKAAKKAEAVAVEPAAKKKNKGAVQYAPAQEPRAVKQAAANKTAKPPRAPKTAAVTLTVPEGSHLTYADAMRTVRQKISLADIGIEGVRPKRALTGALILEIPGTEGTEKAKQLAERMAEALSGTDARVSRPVKTAEMRIRGLDDSATSEDVAAALATVGGCTVGEIKTGDIRRSPTGLGTLWARCPAAAARKAVIAGRIKVGWVSAKVEALEARPLQCHRCLQWGHVRQRCTAATDRSTLCYNCGEPGHRAGQCTAKAPHCPICADAGKPAKHRMGARQCPKIKGKKQIVNSSQGPAAKPTMAAPRGEKAADKLVGITQPAPSGSGLEEAMEVA